MHIAHIQNIVLPQLKDIVGKVPSNNPGNRSNPAFNLNKPCNSKYFFFICVIEDSFAVLFCVVFGSITHKKNNGLGSPVGNRPTPG